MTTIDVLGPGCGKCARLEKSVRHVVAELGIDADVRKITDLDAMIRLDVFVTPALVIDGRVVCAGRVPTGAELRRLLVP